MSLFSFAAFAAICPCHVLGFCSIVDCYLPSIKVYDLCPSHQRCAVVCWFRSNRSSLLILPSRYRTGDLRCILIAYRHMLILCFCDILLGQCVMNRISQCRGAARRDVQTGWSNRSGWSDLRCLLCRSIVQSWNSPLPKPLLGWCSWCFKHCDQVHVYIYYCCHFGALD